MAKPQTVHRLELVPPQRRGPGRPGGQRQVVDVTLRTSDRMLLSVEEAADRLGIGRTSMRMLLRTGDTRASRRPQPARVPVRACPAKAGAPGALTPYSRSNSATAGGGNRQGHEHRPWFPP